MVNLGNLIIKSILAFAFAFCFPKHGARCLFSLAVRITSYYSKDGKFIFLYSTYIYLYI